MGFFSPIIREHIAKVAGRAYGRMLDVGCGNKPYRDLFPMVREYVGLDRPSSVDLNRPEPEKRKAHYDVEGSADAIPFPPARFETILCTQVIEHLPSPQTFFNEAWRVAAPGALLILTAPLVNPEHEVPYDFLRFTKYGLAELCHSSGWIVESLKPMGGSWLAVGYLFLQTAEQCAVSATKKWRKCLWRTLGKNFYTLFIFLDRHYPQTDAPVGYLLVARKPTRQ